MKKTILLSLIAGAFSQFAAAQDANQITSNAQTEDNLKKVRIGAFVAPNMSWMRPSAAKDGDQTQKNGGYKLGFTYGLMLDYNFTENYAIATGLQVNSTGGIIETENLKAVDGGVLKSNINYNLQYFEIPLALKLKTDPVGKFRFFGQAGLSVGINISKKATYEVLQKRSAGDTTFIATEKEKITGGLGVIAPLLFQMNVGAGFQYAIGPKLDAYVGVFFNNGFAPNVTIPQKMNNFPDFNPEFKDGNTRLNNFALRLGFYF